MYKGASPTQSIPAYRVLPALSRRPSSFKWTTMICVERVKHRLFKTSKSKHNTAKRSDPAKKCGNQPVFRCKETKDPRHKTIIQVQYWSLGFCKTDLIDDRMCWPLIGFKRHVDTRLGEYTYSIWCGLWIESKNFYWLRQPYSKASKEALPVETWKNAPL